MRFKINMEKPLNYGDNGEEQYLDENPLSLCPNSPNCVRISKYFKDIRPDQLMISVVTVLHKMKPAVMNPDTENRIVKSVFNVFIFKDDFEIAITGYENGAILHVRSSSRIGYGDLGVNKYRMNKFLIELDGVMGTDA